MQLEFEQPETRRERACTNENNSQHQRIEVQLPVLSSCLPFHLLEQLFHTIEFQGTLFQPILLVLMLLLSRMHFAGTPRLCICRPRLKNSKQQLERSEGSRTECSISRSARQLLPNLHDVA
jgi:hypothetical protein